MGIKKTLNLKTGRYEVDKPKQVIWTTLGLHYRIEALEKQVKMLLEARPVQYFGRAFTP